MSYRPYRILSKTNFCRTVRKRRGVVNITLLDLLTCALGAVIVLLFTSIAANIVEPGIAPGTIITFSVSDDSPAKGKLGVRVTTKNGLKWAGDGANIEAPIVIDPQEEGDSTVTLILTGDYAKEDRCYVFVHELDAGTFKENGAVIKIDVHRNLQKLEPNKPIELSEKELFRELDLQDLR